MPGTRSPRWARLAAVGLVAAVLLVALGAAPAQAAGYRYWSFWQRSGDADTWTYATQGPSTDRPGDGSTIGFRFAVSADSAHAAEPRSAPGFAAICGTAPAGSGTKRVAVVLDFGTSADAPDGTVPPKGRTACARIGSDGTAGDALAAVAKPLRYASSGLLCAIAGYPVSGCGDAVDDPGSGSKHGSSEHGADGSSAAQTGGGGPSAGLIGGIAAVAVLAAAAVWQARRRRP
jgi:hypothetical protein